MRARGRRPHHGRRSPRGARRELVSSAPARPRTVDRTSPDFTGGNCETAYGPFRTVMADHCTPRPDATLVLEARPPTTLRSTEAFAENAGGRSSRVPILTRSSWNLTPAARYADDPNPTPAADTPTGLPRCAPYAGDPLTLCTLRPERGRDPVTPVAGQPRPGLPYARPAIRRGPEPSRVDRLAPPEPPPGFLEPAAGPGAPRSDREDLRDASPPLPSRPLPNPRPRGPNCGPGTSRNASTLSLSLSTLAPLNRPADGAVLRAGFRGCRGAGGRYAPDRPGPRPSVRARLR